MGPGKNSEGGGMEINLNRVIAQVLATSAIVVGIILTVVGVHNVAGLPAEYVAHMLCFGFVLVLISSALYFMKETNRWRLFAQASAGLAIVVSIISLVMWLQMVKGSSVDTWVLLLHIFFIPFASALLFLARS